jgi:hypothetical protein
MISELNELSEEIIEQTKSAEKVLLMCGCDVRLYGWEGFVAVRLSFSASLSFLLLFLYTDNYFEEKNLRL